MLLRGEQRAVGLGVGHLRIVHQLAGQRALLKEFLAIVEQFLGGLFGLFGGIDVGLRFDHGFGNLRRGGGAQVGLGLVQHRPAFGGAGGEIAAFQDGEQLSLFDVIAALHQEALHRRRDLRHHPRLVAREEHAIARHDAADGVLGDGSHLDGRGRFDFLLLLFGAGDKKEKRNEQERFLIHGLEGPRKSLKSGQRQAVARPVRRRMRCAR